MNEHFVQKSDHDPEIRPGEKIPGGPLTDDEARILHQAANERAMGYADATGGTAILSDGSTYHGGQRLRDILRTRGKSQ